MNSYLKQDDIQEILESSLTNGVPQYRVRLYDQRKPVWVPLYRFKDCFHLIVHYERDFITKQRQVEKPNLQIQIQKRLAEFKQQLAKDTDGPWLYQQFGMMLEFKHAKDEQNPVIQHIRAEVKNYLEKQLSKHADNVGTTTTNLKALDDLKRNKRLAEKIVELDKWTKDRANGQVAFLKKKVRTALKQAKDGAEERLKKSAGPKKQSLFQKATDCVQQFRFQEKKRLNELYDAIIDSINKERQQSFALIDDRCDNELITRKRIISHHISKQVDGVLEPVYYKLQKKFAVYQQIIDKKIEQDRLACVQALKRSYQKKFEQQDQKPTKKKLEDLSDFFGINQEKALPLPPNILTRIQPSCVSISELSSLSISASAIGSSATANNAKSPYQSPDNAKPAPADSEMVAEVLSSVVIKVSGVIAQQTSIQPQSIYNNKLLAGKYASSIVDAFIENILENVVNKGVWPAQKDVENVHNEVEQIAENKLILNVVELQADIVQEQKYIPQQENPIVSEAAIVIELDQVNQNKVNAQEEENHQKKKNKKVSHKDKKIQKKRTQIMQSEKMEVPTSSHLYIKGIPFDVTKDQFWRKLEQETKGFLRWTPCRHGNRSAGFGFAKYKSKARANQAMNYLDGLVYNFFTLRANYRIKK